MKNEPTSINRETMQNPLLVLGKIMLFGLDNYLDIRRQEGQQQFLNAAILPTKMSRNCDAKKILEEAGIKFLSIVENDRLFQHVELPHGWKIVAADRVMWSWLIDAKDRKRARIVYKSDFYDRNALLSLLNRFEISFDREYFYKTLIGVSNVIDSDTIIYSTKHIVATNENECDYIESRANKLAIEWLNSNYPNWEDPGAYWD